MDTIVAISTAPGIGGIGIIRISGPKTFEIIKKIFKPKKELKIDEIKGYTIKYGHILDGEDIIDEVLVSFFKAPYSYTTENMCEINSHGGNFVIKKILETCLKNGAKLAEPGEFTKRAFLNGRIDLSQAESVIDIINAKTEKEAKNSVNQLEGYLSKEISKIREMLLNIMVDIEVSIDYPEYDVEEVSNTKALDTIDKIINELNKMLDSFENGKIIKDGIKMALIGKPNVGKSSLLNAILKEERAIVTEIEGTTRDTIEEFVTIEGIPINIIDTAGIRNASDEIEKIGIAKSKKIADEADLIIAIFDSTKKLDNEDKEILNLLKDKKSIIVLNKMDLKSEKIEKEYIENEINNAKIIPISAKDNIGIDKIYKEISNLFNLNEIKLDNSMLITNIRHKNIIEQSLKDLEEAKKAISKNLPIDITSVFIKNAMEELGKITGESVSESIIKEIFAKFCLGK